jgi:hypothetical protein
MKYLVRNPHLDPKEYVTDEWVDEEDLNKAKKLGFYGVSVHPDYEGEELTDISNLRKAVQLGFKPVTKEVESTKLSDYPKLAYGLGEVAAQMGTGAASDLGSLLYSGGRQAIEGLGRGYDYAFGDITKDLFNTVPEDRDIKADRTRIQQAGTFMPRTEHGQRISGEVGHFLAPIGEKLKSSGRSLADTIGVDAEKYPDVRASVEDLPADLLGIFPVGRAARGLKEAGKTAGDVIMAERGARRFEKAHPDDVDPAGNYTGEGMIAEQLRFISELPKGDQGPALAKLRKEISTYRDAPDYSGTHPKFRTPEMTESELMRGAVEAQDALTASTPGYFTKVKENLSEGGYTGAATRGLPAAAVSHFLGGHPLVSGALAATGVFGPAAIKAAKHSIDNRAVDQLFKRPYRELPGYHSPVDATLPLATSEAKQSSNPLTAKQRLLQQIDMLIAKQRN